MKFFVEKHLDIFLIIDGNRFFCQIYFRNLIKIKKKIDVVHAVRFSRYSRDELKAHESVVRGCERAEKRIST